MMMVVMKMVMTMMTMMVAMNKVMTMMTKLMSKNMTDFEGDG